jgi:hypothetical protein
VFAAILFLGFVQQVPQSVVLPAIFSCIYKLFFLKSAAEETQVRECGLLLFQQQRGLFLVHSLHKTLSPFLLFGLLCFILDMFHITLSSFGLQ